jgi:hypothetical protein
MASARGGLVGAGRTGLPMVERLAAADTDLLVLARRADVIRADRLTVRLGGRDEHRAAVVSVVATYADP